MDNIACPVCGGAAFKKLSFFSVPSRYDKKKYPLYKCHGCGLIRPRPLPYTERTKYDIYDEEGLTKCYNPDVKKIDFESREYKDYFKNFRAYARYIKDLGIKGRHLDIGCGSGHLMQISRGMGLDPQGVELNPGIARALCEAGFNVQTEEIASPVYPAGSYALVTMNHVLEHIDDLQPFVDRVRCLLKDDGYIILGVPYIYGLMPRLLRTFWYGHGHGQHLNLFSVRSIKTLFERAGFKLIMTEIGSLDYAPLFLPRRMRKFIDLFFAGISGLKMGDNLFVVLTKISAKGGRD